MTIDFSKSADGLVPAIIQDNVTGKVLMLGYMNAEALEKTQREGVVTFFSRSRQCLWTKGETSGNFLHVVSMAEDCDHDTLLIKAHPDGPTCHTGTDTCWGEVNKADEILDLKFVQDAIIQKQKKSIAATNNSDVIGLCTNHLDEIIKTLAQSGCRLEDVARELKSRYSND